MSWDLRIQGRSPQRDVLDTGKPMGQLSNVYQALESYFPGLVWSQTGRGVFDDSEIMLELAIHGEPVEDVCISVRRGDPSIHLLALAESYGWDVVDEDRSIFLDEDVAVDCDEVKALQEVVQSRQGQQRRDATRKKLPGIKRSQALSEVQPEWRRDRMCFIELDALQLADECCDEQIAWAESAVPAVLVGGYGFGWEVQTPEGRRFACFEFSNPDHDAEKRAVIAFASSSQRVSGMISGSCFVTSDGQQVATRDCMFIERKRSRS